MSLLLLKLLFYLGKIGLWLELNSEGNDFSFICCAKQQTILLGVPRAWRVLQDHRLSDLEWSFLSVITTCDRSANIHVASSTFYWLEEPRPVLLFQRESCIFEQFVFSACIFSFVPDGVK